MGKEGRYIEDQARDFRFGIFLRQIPNYTQQTEVLLTKSEHISFIFVAFEIQKEELTRILSLRLDERSGHRSK